VERNNPSRFPPQSILVAVDGSEFSKRAATYAGELASMTKAKVTLAHAVLVPTMASDETAGMLRRDLSSKAEGFLTSMAESMKPGNAVEWKIVETDTSVVRAIIDLAENIHAGLIVTGTRGVSGYGKMVLGSVAAGIVGYAHCPVLTVR
jgi:nucleotide-binding universal stress UspA family protein